MLKNKSILLGITGGIAAFKCPELIRQIQALGGEVQVVMTPSAEAFVTPLTLQTLSRAPVHLSRPLSDAMNSSGAIDHIRLARWADIILIAPASAHCMAKLAHGLADDLLSTLCLASTTPIMIAPAMNQAMWRHPSTQANKATLEQRGVLFLGPEEGEQACQEIGPGRLLETEKIVASLVQYLTNLQNRTSQETTHNGILKGVPVVITAGPTQEPIDPVRYISNRSSGKMGYALARAAVEAGADVTLISGPTSCTPPPNLNYISVNTAQEMLNAVNRVITARCIFISAAAVSDFRPNAQATQKIKKSTTGSPPHLHLTPTVDIVSTVAQSPHRPAYVVGFAAETEHLKEHALKKLKHKHLDLVVANEVGHSDRGFDSEQNEVLLVWADGEQLLPLKPKAALAKEIIDIIKNQMGGYSL